MEVLGCQSDDKEIKTAVRNWLLGFIVYLLFFVYLRLTAEKVGERRKRLGLPIWTDGVRWDMKGVAVKGQLDSVYHSQKGAGQSFFKDKENIPPFKENG